LYLTLNALTSSLLLAKVSQPQPQPQPLEDLMKLLGRDMVENIITIIRQNTHQYADIIDRMQMLNDDWRTIEWHYYHENRDECEVFWKLLNDVMVRSEFFVQISAQQYRPQNPRGEWTHIGTFRYVERFDTDEEREKHRLW
jgi:hypothetical protein